MLYIKDDIREAYLNAINNRIRNGKSALVVGKYGCGKSSLLDQVRPPKKRPVVRIESLAPLHHLLSSILVQLNYAVNRKSTGNALLHLEEICTVGKEKRAVIIIDEANDLRPQIWAFLKRIMNAEIPVIMAGLPKTEAYLERDHADILSRLKVLRLQPVRLETFKQCWSDKFTPDALDLIYGAAGENMRVFDEICDDCRDKAQEMKAPQVTVDIAMMFIDG